MTTVGLDVPAYSDAPSSFYPQFVAAAADAGYRNLWVGDHLLWHRPRFEQFALLGMLSGLTDLTLGSGIALAPLRQPWWLAKAAATLSMTARGGFVLGVGTGGEYAREFELAGVSREGRGSALDATIEFCRRAWSGEEGQDFSPILETPLPIVVGGRTPPALRRAARLGDGWLGIFLTPDAFAKARALLLEEAAGHGRPDPATAMTVWVCTDQDAVRAQQIATEVIAEEYRLPAEKFARHVVTGTPHDVAESLAAYVRLGVDHLDLHLAHPDPLTQIEPLGDALSSRLAAEGATQEHPVFARGGNGQSFPAK
jgi:alkanesulfonate monooxygenase SsuD/methylene tetrahydromethanopterin reductase-like flavin-dependent oxidoreductase (luciferase family)